MGFENKYLLSLISTILPKYKTIILSLICLAILKSWVIKIKVNLNSFCKSLSKFITCAWIETSRADTGSSQIISLGFNIRALAIPIRLHCPPENSCG